MDGVDRFRVFQRQLALIESVLVLGESVLVLVIESGSKNSQFSSTLNLAIHTTSLYLLQEQKSKHEHESGAIF